MITSLEDLIKEYENYLKFPTTYDFTELDNFLETLKDQELSILEDFIKICNEKVDHDNNRTT